MEAELLRSRPSAYRGIELRMIQSTVNGLFARMGHRFRNFPNDYLVLDIETTGVRVGKDHITQLGYCMVVDNKIIDQTGIVLNWPSYYPSPETHERMKELLALTKAYVETKNGRPTGKKYHMTFDKMVNEGVDPIVALDAYLKLLEDARKSGIFYVTHNGYHFDALMLESHFEHFLHKSFKFGDDEMFDTGMVLKGAQSNSVPWQGESIRSWSMRTYTDRLKNVKWSLDQCAVPLFKLAEKHHLNMDDAHDAGFDCALTHYLLEEYKSIAAGNSPEPEFAFRTDNLRYGAPTRVEEPDKPMQLTVDPWKEPGDK